MASDQLVSSRLILEALLELQRRGSERAMEELEKIEPELATYLMENLSLIHQKLLATGARPKETLRLQRRIENLAMVCIAALRKAHYQLWQDAASERIRQLDPADEQEPPPAASAGP